MSLRQDQAFSLFSYAWSTHHWKYLTSNLTLLYLLGSVCCQQIHRNQICLWILICTLLWGLIIFYFDIRFGQHIQIHRKPNIKIEFDFGYFQWKLSTSFSYPLDSFNKVLAVLVAQVVGHRSTDSEVSSSNLHWKLFFFFFCFVYVLLLQAKSLRDCKVGAYL